MCEQRSVKSERAGEGLLQVETKEEVAAEILHTKVEIAAGERRASKKPKLVAAKTKALFSDMRHHVPDLPAAERRAMKGESSVGHVMKKEQVDDQAVPRAAAKYLEDHVMKKEEDDDQADTNFYYLDDALQNLDSFDALQAKNEEAEDIEEKEGDLEEFCRGCNERIGQLDYKRTGKKKQNIWHLSCLDNRNKGKTDQDRSLLICPRCHQFVDMDTEEFVITKSKCTWHRVCKDAHEEMLKKKDVQCPGCGQVRCDDPMPATWIRRNSRKLWCQSCYFVFSGSNRWVENIDSDDA
jgi:hypothetical protein